MVPMRIRTTSGSRSDRRPMKALGEVHPPGCEWSTLHRPLLCIAAAALLITEAGQAQLRDPSGYIFVADRTRAEIAVIDSRTDVLVERIAVPAIPDQILALEKGARLVVADATAHQVRVIDVVGGLIEYSLSVPLAPRIISANKTGTMLAVLDPEAGKAALQSVAGGPPLPISGLMGARYAAFDLQGQLLIAHDADVATIAVTGQHKAELIADPDDGPITHLATDPAGEYIFVVQDERSVLTIFDRHNRTRAAVLRFPAPLGRIVSFALLPVGGHAVSIISTWTFQESHRIEVAGSPVSVGLTLFQSVAAIAIEPGHRLLLYDLQNRHPLASLQLPGTPEFGASSPNGTKYYVALADTGQVAVVELTKHAALRLIDSVGLGAWAVVPAIGDAYCH